jgi:HAD superfamily hydrolase (TIGR01509 family)
MIVKKFKNFAELIDLIKFDTVKGILIDIDDTLYDYKTTHNKIINLVYNYLDENQKEVLPRDKFVKTYTSLRKQITKELNSNGSSRSRLFAFQRLAENLTINQPFVFGERFENIYWDLFLNEIQPFPHVKEFLNLARNMGIVVCAVSDMQTAVQIKKILKLDLEEYIDFLVTSEEVGHEKPNKKIFEKALKKINLQNDQVVMIGDSMAKDIEGAKSLKIDSYLKI